MPILWPRDVKNRLIWKDPDTGKDWRQEEKGTTEKEMVGWHHQHDGHEFELALGVGDRQGSLLSCIPWGHRIRHNWVTELNWILTASCRCLHIWASTPTCLYTRRQEWPRWASCNHCGSISTGPTQALLLALVQTDGESRGKHLHLGNKHWYFRVEERVREWPEGSQETNMSLQHDHPLDLTWFHQQESCLLSGPQGLE